MKQFFAIKPEVGKPIVGNVIRKDNVMYYYRDITTKRFVSLTEIHKRYRDYKASLERKDQRWCELAVVANGDYTNAERMLIKTACHAELCGVRCDLDNFRYYRKYQNSEVQK